MMSVLSHKFTLCILCAAYATILLFTIAARAQQPTQEQSDIPISIEPVELSITKPIPDQQFALDIVFDEPGTRITSILTCEDPDFRIIDFDARSSAITNFTDDRGTDLLETLRRLPQFRGNASLILQNVIQSRSDISQDGRYLALDFYSPDIPAKNATNINIQAILALRVAAGTTSQTHNDIPIKVGPVFDLKNIGLRIVSIEPVSWGNTRQIIGFSVPNEIADTLASINILNQGNKDITDSRIAFTRLPNRTILEYTITERPRIANLQIEFYNRSQTIQVPLDINTSLGL